MLAAMAPAVSAADIRRGTAALGFEAGQQGLLGDMLAFVRSLKKTAFIIISAILTRWPTTPAAVMTMINTAYIDRWR